MGKPKSYDIAVENSRTIVKRKLEFNLVHDWVCTTATYLAQLELTMPQFATELYHFLI